MEQYSFVGRGRYELHTDLRHLAGCANARA
jgi:hypothetical protein